MSRSSMLTVIGLTSVLGEVDVLDGRDGAAGGSSWSPNAAVTAGEASDARRLLLVGMDRSTEDGPAGEVV